MVVSSDGGWWDGVSTADVSVPVSVALPSAAGVRPASSNVICGWRSTAKKSLVRRCASRFLIPVLIVSASTRRAPLDATRAVDVKLAIETAVAAAYGISPRMRVRKPSSLRAGSTCQSPGESGIRDALLPSVW